MSAQAALIERLLFARTSPERLSALKTAAAAPDLRWDEVIAKLETHGILLLAKRHLSDAGVALADELVRRAAPLCEDSRRVRLTLERFIEETHRLGIEVMLLKGCSLDLDVYPEPGLRTQSDIDVMVREGDLSAATLAAARAGVAPDERQFPEWWYRLTHFHLKLRPTHAFAKMMELHWRLHADALLLTDKVEDLWARSVAHEIAGVAVRSLDPLDRFLHLATHLSSHGHGLAAGNLGELVASTLADPQPDIRLKWVVDLVAVGEMLATTCTPEALLERARTWNAEPDLLSISRLLQKSDVRYQVPFFDLLVSTLAPAVGASATRGNGPEIVVHSSGGEEARDGFDFRWSALRRLPIWLVPPRSYIVKRYPSAEYMPIVLVRLGHAASVLSRIMFALMALPVALLARATAAPGRRRRRAQAPSPDAVLDLVARWHGTQRSTTLGRESKGRAK